MANFAKDSEILYGMEMPNEEVTTREDSPPSEKRGVVAEPDFNTPLTPIVDFVARPDFPECILGEHVDIGGYAGVVVAIVKHSIKVRSQEGATRSFNSFGLRRIYGPPPELPPELKSENPRFAPVAPAPTVRSEPADEDEPPEPAPRHEVVDEPNFEQPIVSITELVARPDYPKCTFGRHVEIGGYTGVVVEILNQSLRVRSSQGTSRNYNALVLRNLHQQP
jgi:hypothetical protein